MRFIHTSDWQLGKPFGRAPDEARAALHEARLDAIDTLAAAARREGANLVLVAGDVFDSPEPGDRVYRQALTRMKAAADIRWVMLPGNHDPARADGLWSRLVSEAPDTVLVCLEPRPLELAEGYWLLPAPLQYKRTQNDPTAWFNNADTPEGVKRRERLLEDRLGLVSEIAQLEERAKTLGGSGPASRAATAAELAEAAAATHDRLREEAEMLTLLAETIRDAQRETSRRFLAPITERVAPFIARLLPSASVVFGEDMRPTLLSRGGREESTDDLSKGTQEQLAVLTRLAFADLLIEKGKPASVVLDDALVFADDDRFEAMLDILSEAAERMQIIILSCRTSAYRGLNAHRILLG